jgi:hypothetical protein
MSLLFAYWFGTKAGRPTSKSRQSSRRCCFTTFLAGAAFSGFAALIMVIRVKAPKKIRPTDDAWIVQAAGHERRRDCSFRGGNIRIFATVDV